MKKFVSMVMAAAMVVSLVPATAFAATGYVTADKVVIPEVVEKAEEFGTPEGFISKEEAPEVQIVLDDVIGEKTGTREDVVEFDITYTVSGAELKNENGSDFTEEGALYLLSIDKETVVATSIDTDEKGRLFGTINGAKVTVTDLDDDTVTFSISGVEENFTKVIAFDLRSTMDDTDAGSTATVSVESDIVGADITDEVYAEVKEEGIDAILKGDLAEVAEEEATALEKDLKIETTIGDFAAGQMIKLTLKGGFEFENGSFDLSKTTNVKSFERDADDEDVAWVEVDEAKDFVVLKVGSFKVDAVDAKAGDICKIVVKAIAEDAEGEDIKVAIEGTDEVEAVKVVGEAVVMELDDEDEDLPVIYSGVDVGNTGITDDSDHVSLKVKISETTAAALDEKKAFTLTLPEGVYATDVVVTGEKNVNLASFDDDNDGLMAAFAAAYEKGEHETFEFARKTFADSEEAFEFYFTMTLVAEPTFVGDVVLTLDGAGFEEAQEVTIAKFVAPFTVEAQQNDVIIDYRYTEIPTDIVIKEAEAGLWEDSADEKMTFTFGIDRLADDSDEAFEDDAVYTVNEESEMEIDEAKDGVGFTVKEESEDEAAVITINNISLYMNRSIAAGAYDLELSVDKASAFYLEELFTTKETKLADSYGVDLYTVAEVLDYVDGTALDVPAATVKEGFVNVITAGRDKDDASFTTKVVVPVGEAYIVAGEQTVALDVPAYVSASGYTMLPVRAVAVALGILNNNVLWDQASKTVTILYGQRIITMTVGAKVINVNGSAIPASSSPEVVDGRTFLPMRDLATALGVTDITWDAATKTATLNGNK